MSNFNLADALFSKVLQKVLALLYGHPDSRFYTNEIIRLTHSGTGAVQRELVKLTRVELITVEDIGNQKHYKANQSHPLYSELRSIVIKTFGVANILQDVLLPIASRIKVAFIYGSIAKQTDTAKSDVDLMIIHDNLAYADVFPLLESAEVKLSRKVNPTLYSTSEWTTRRAKDNHFLNQVISQPKIFLIGTEDDLKKFG